jgi:uncharacterized protein
MPPPSIPAKHDPTTVSSIPYPNSPRVFTGKLPSSSLSSVPLSDPQLPSPSTPFANLSLLSPTASHSSNSSPLSPKLSTLTSSFLTITSTTSPDADTCGPTQMDMDEDPDPCDSGPTPRVRSPSPQPLSSSEPLTREGSRPKNPVEPLSPTLSVATPGPSVESDPPPTHSPPLVASSPPPLKVPKVKMSLKDFAMRKKKQREEELARAAALPPSPTLRNGGSVDVSPDSDPPLDPARNFGITDGASETSSQDTATPRVSIAVIDSVAEPTVLRRSATDMDHEPSLYSLPQISDVHFDTSLASTLAEIAQVIPPGKGCQLQDDVGAVKGSTPVTHEVKCNGDAGGHLNSVSPRSSRTPSPSLTESEDSETGNGMTMRGMLPPPTQPRSFGVSASASPVLSSSGGGGALPHRLPPSSTYRPGSSYVPPSIPPSVRPLPSGPRALRAGMGGGFTSGQQQQQQQQQPTARGYGHHHPHGHPHGPGSFAGVPRGPSSSVERERDRDRGWIGVMRGRGRGATSSWGGR